MTQRCFNIIDSVKGGSGKTSLSLMLTLAAQRHEEEKKKEEDAKAQEEKEEDAKDIRYSLLMDMDMQGSSLDHLLFEGATNPELKKAPQTLNDAILLYYRRETPQFISEPKFFFSNDFGAVPSSPDEPTAVEGGPENSCQIAVALASTKTDDRDCFRAVSRMNYSSQITYDAFGSGLRAVLKESNLSSYLPDHLKYIFFDMPPNSNGYSDCVLELLLSGDRKKSVINPQYPRNYFELMTLDHGHISATLDWFEQFVTRERYHFPDHFFFVFSNVPLSISKMEFDEGKKQFEDEYLRSTVDNIQKRLKSLALKDEDRRRIRLVGVFYQEEYLRRCCRAGSLLNSASTWLLSPRMLTPIKFLMTVDGKCSMDCTGELLELMCARE